MSQKPAVVVAGASGRMGRMLIDAVLAHHELRLVAATERAGHEWVGADLGVALGRSELGFAVTDTPASAIEAAQIVLDFTSPGATCAHAELAAEAQAVHVIGTTGFQADDLAAIDRAARRTAIIRAGNMSLGVNLLVQLTRQVARALDADYDIEVVEAHHRHKVDAPSGTALMLGEAAAEGRGIDLAQMRESGRDGITGARAPGAIGFSAIRGGEVVGEHDVIFAGQGERIVLRHLASDRMVFANGALKAALWGLDQPPGHYDMLDVLGLKQP